MHLAEAAEALYEELRAAGVEVMFDDRAVRPGVMFADSELIGIPHRLVLGDKGLDKGIVEYKRRADGHAEELARDDVVQWIRTRIAKELASE
jgi:prolyl-tRNA synthetase